MHSFQLLAWSYMISASPHLLTQFLSSALQPFYFTNLESTYNLTGTYFCCKDRLILFHKLLSIPSFSSLSLTKPTSKVSISQTRQYWNSRYNLLRYLTPIPVLSLVYQRKCIFSHGKHNKVYTSDIPKKKKKRKFW